MDKKQMFFHQPNTSPLVAIYSRCSTKGKGQDTENQALELRAYCQRMGFAIYKEYTDYESGGTSNRSELKQLFDDAHKRKFDLVLFWSLDRFSREGVLVTINLLQQLESYGVKYKSYTEQYLDSSGIFKDAIVSLIATLALQEKVRLSERVKAGLLKSRKAGRIGGRPKIDEVKILAIKQYRQEGLSLRMIGKKLNIHHMTVKEYAQPIISKELNCAKSIPSPCIFSGKMEF